MHVLNKIKFLLELTFWLAITDTIRWKHRVFESFDFLLWFYHDMISYTHCQSSHRRYIGMAVRRDGYTEQ